MNSEVLKTDREFKKVSLLLKNNPENSTEMERAFIKAFFKWHDRVERLNEQIKRAQKRQIVLTFEEYTEMMDDLQNQKKKISDSYIEKFCTIIGYLTDEIKGIDEVIAQILKECVTKHDRKVERWIENTIWSENKTVMKAIITEKGKAITVLSEKLANDAEFMLYFVCMYAGTKEQWALYRKIGENLKYNNEFVVKFLISFVTKYRNDSNLLGLKQDFFQIIKTVYDDKRMSENVFINENVEFWRAVKELKLDEDLNNRTLTGMMNRVILYCGEDPEEDANEQKNLSERIKYLIQNPDELTTAQRDNFILMTSLIKLDVSMYVQASSRLKMKNSFNIDAVELGVPKEVIEDEKQKILLQRAQKKETSLQEQKVGYQKKEELIYGEGTEFYLLAEDYLSTDDSIEDYCLKNNIHKNEFEKVLNLICKLHPKIAKKRDERKNKIQAELKQNSLVIIEKIMSDENYIYQFAKDNNSKVKISNLIIYADDKRKLIEIIMSAIVSKKLKLNDYIRLFSFNYVGTMKKIYKFINCVEENFPEWEGNGRLIKKARMEVAKLNKCEEVYQECDFLGDRRGFCTESGEMELVEITKERLEEVLKYLQDNDEFVCKYTVNEAIKLFLKEWLN